MTSSTLDPSSPYGNQETYVAASPLETLVRTYSGSAGRPPKQPTQLSHTAITGSEPGPSIRRPPSSPLLHTRFRHSEATSESSGRTSKSEFTTQYGDDAARHSTTSTIPPSSTALPYLADPNSNQWDERPVPRHHDPNRETWQSSAGAIDPYGRANTYHTAPPVVVVHEPTLRPSEEGPRPPASGRTASTVPAAYNFSRPMRVAAPSGGDGDRSSNVSNYEQSLHPRSPQFRSPSPQASSPTRSFMPDSPRTPSRRSPTSSPEPERNHLPSDQHPTQRNRPPMAIHLPSTPPDFRPGSSASLYSSYSFYALPDDLRTPSPREGRHMIDPRSTPTPPSTVPTSPVHPPATKSRPNASQTDLPLTTGPMSAQDYLTLGIKHHEANRLTESAQCFERSAKEGGGCGVGMLMWGLSLRHAWGCPKDERKGFWWLRKAAESAVDDLDAAKQGQDIKAVKTELVLAIYEVGQCFFHGWGVAQDKKMAVSYFQVAARLGDADAQQELAFCYANGKGCKKDLKLAAKWYRAAAEQGASTVGLAWIYKSKYDP